MQRTPPTPTPTARWLAPATAALALGTAALALLGPLALGVVRYRVSPLLRDQLIGADAVSLAVFTPLGLLAAWLTHRRSPAGPLLALGTSTASWYLAAELVVAPDRSLAGNDELFLPLFLGVLLLGAAVAVGAWRCAASREPSFDRPAGTVLGWCLLVLVALLVVGRYVPAWLAIVGGHPPADYLAGPAVWWTVAFEDLALLLPALAVTGIGLLRGARWAARAAFPAAGCLGLVGAAVAGMAWSTTLHGDPGSDLGTALMMTAIGLISAGPWLLCWLSLTPVPEPPYAAEAAAAERRGAAGRDAYRRGAVRRVAAGDSGGGGAGRLRG